jgi:hypothetical protein
MEILGYIAYAALLFLAVTWTLGVRMTPDAGVHTICGAMFFLASAVVLSVIGANWLHAVWLIAAGFILSMLLPLVAVHAPPLFSPLRLLASTFAGIVRLGR